MAARPTQLVPLLLLLAAWQGAAQGQPCPENSTEREALLQFRAGLADAQVLDSWTANSTAFDGVSCTGGQVVSV